MSRPATATIGRLPVRADRMGETQSCPGRSMAGVRQVRADCRRRVHRDRGLRRGRIVRADINRALSQTRRPAAAAVVLLLLRPGRSRSASAAAVVRVGAWASASDAIKARLHEGRRRAAAKAAHHHPDGRIMCGLLVPGVLLWIAFDIRAADRHSAEMAGDRRWSSRGAHRATRKR